ncbi:MAG: hypothetical protein ACRDJ9_33290 [Dehalococcoidia bacterium]
MNELRQTKFWLAAGVFVAAAVFLVIGRIDQETWREVVLWMLGLYGAANIGATFTHGRIDKKEDRTDG